MDLVFLSLKTTYNQFFTLNVPNYHRKKTKKRKKMKLLIPNMFLLLE